jgi:hypothetical protein
MKLEWQVLSLKLHTLLFDTLQQTFSPRNQEEWKAGCTKNNCHTLIIIVKFIPASLGREYKSNQFFNLLYEENRRQNFTWLLAFQSCAPVSIACCYCQHGLLDRYVLFACFELGMGSLPKLLDSWRFQLQYGCHLPAKQRIDFKMISAVTLQGKQNCPYF